MDMKQRMPDGKWRLKIQIRRKAVKLGAAMGMCVLLGAAESFLPDTGVYTTIKFVLGISTAGLLLNLVMAPAEKDDD